MLKQQLQLAASLLAALAATLALAGPGPFPQPAFTQQTFNGGASVVGITSKGNIYIAGAFTAASGQPRNGLARFKPDGALDAWTPTLPALPAPTAPPTSPPSLPSPPRVRTVVEDAAGNVAIAFQGAGEYYITYVPADTQVGVLVASQDSRDGNLYTLGAITFDASGALYVAFTQRAGFWALDGTASVRKYVAGTTPDPSFNFPTLYGGASLVIGDVNYYRSTGIAVMQVHGIHLYVGGSFAGGGLARASTATGALDSAWKPLANSRVQALLVTPQDVVYAAGVMDTGGTDPSGLRRFSTQGNGQRDMDWNPRLPLQEQAAMALDPVGKHLYLMGDGFGRRPELAIDTVSGALVEAWDPGPQRRDYQWVYVSHVVFLGDRVLLAGTFTFVGDQPRELVAAIPPATAPVSWPVASVSPALIDFGTSFVYQTRARSFKLSNVGESNLVFQGTDPALDVSHDCAPAIVPRGSCTITVNSLVQADTGTDSTAPYTRTLSVKTNAAGSPRFVTLTYHYGNGFRFENAAQGVWFPRTPVGFARTKQVTVRNTLSGPLAIEGARTFSGTFGSWMYYPNPFTISSDCPPVLQAGSTCTLTIQFSPKVSMGMSGDLRLAADTSGPRLGLVGYGVDPAADEDGDGIPNGVEMTFARNLEVKDNDVFSDARLFAMQQFRDFLGREGEDGGVAYWAASIERGVTSRAEAVAAFLESAEFGAVTGPVARLYLAYFLRLPDSGGLDYWTGQYRAGNPLNGISSAFAQSPEFQALYGSLEDAQFVDRVYRNVLGRAPDAGGEAFWKSRLAAGMSRGEMMVAFSESAEFHAFSSNTVFLTMVYAALLKRAPEPGGYASWVAYLNAGNPRSGVIQAALDSPEYRARFLP